jgi:hypothetical protein
MKIYTVEGIQDMEVNPGNFVEVSYFYGVFSSVDEANKIANHLRENIMENNSQEKIFIFVKERTLNEPTEDYFMEVKVIPSFKKD